MKDIKDAKKIARDDNFDLYYWVNWKPGMKDFLVLHPAASMNHSSLETLESGLNERGYATIIFDQRGIGYSAAPAKREMYSLDKHSEDLQKIIEMEGLENPGIVTHSFGFMPAIDYAARTGNVSKIIGICASPDFRKTTNPYLFKLFERVGIFTEYLGWAATSLAHKLKREKRGYNSQSLSGKSDAKVWLSIVDVFLNEINVHIAHGLELNKWDVSEQLKSVKAPLQLIYGKKDLMVKSYAGELIEKLAERKCDIKILEGTHTLPITHPERVLKVI